MFNHAVLQTLTIAIIVALHTLICSEDVQRQTGEVQKNVLILGKLGLRHKK